MVNYIHDNEAHRNFTKVLWRNLIEYASFCICVDLCFSEQLTSSADFIIGNYKHTGFFRVNYDIDTWVKIVELIEKNKTVRGSFI